jgi:trans-aconitate methyltransferase
MPDMQEIKQYSVGYASAVWQTLNQREHCELLLNKADAIDIRVVEKQMGYHLNDANDCWAVTWNSGFRAYVEQLNPEQQADFREQYLQEVAKPDTGKRL